ncbi:biotin/lipoyl-binding protein [Desulfurobacterium sp.]|uniref:efflux RND transporter periplasmic adaptor subunit n=1 Tax=Desulfurobacterium sp. TaxID=2004706 RepID=UPI0026112854|nr:biotin/lipoyl-binding protein [Desulfurobacterium sp.]
MRKILTIVVVAAVVFAGIRLVKKRKAEMEATSLPTIPSITVKTVLPKTGTVTEKTVFTGRALRENTVLVSTKLSGYINRVYVTENQKIRKGTLLAKIDGSEIESGIKQLKENLQAAEKSLEALKLSLQAAQTEKTFAEDKFKRVKALYEAGGASKEQLEGAQTELKLKTIKVESTKKLIEAKQKEILGLKEAIKGKESLLNYTTITSPVNGIVGKVFLKDGNLAVPGKPILSILTGYEKVVFTFPDDIRLEPGQPVIIPKYGIGKITKIYLEAENGLPTAEAVLENGKEIPQGSLINVIVILKKVRGTTVPLNALVHKDKGTYIVARENGKFKLKKVTVVAEDNKKAVIKPSINEPVAVGSESKLIRLVAGGEE